jgi:hypothetical protein
MWVKFIDIGIDESDLALNYLNFQNYHRTALLVFQMIVHDQWGSTFTTLIKSKYESFLLLVLVTIPILISIIMHGFIIANYLRAIARLKEADVILNHPV